MAEFTPEQVAELEQQRHALISAIASGALEVVYDGKSMRYDTFAHMRERVRYLDDLIAGPAAASRRPSFATTTFSRGL